MGRTHRCARSGSLYPEPVHVLVRADGPMRRWRSSKGWRVAIGQQGSASRTTALRVLEAHGLGPKDIKPAGAAARRCADRTAAEGSGRRHLGDRGARRQRPRCACGDSAAVRSRSRSAPCRLSPRPRPGTSPYTIPRGAYATQKPGRAHCRDGGPAARELGPLRKPKWTPSRAMVYEKGLDFASRGSAQGVQVSAANARQGLSIPLHIAAAKALDALAPAAAPSAPTPGVR